MKVNIKNFLNLLIGKKKYFFLSILLVSLLCLGLSGHIAQASWLQNKITLGLGWIIYGLVYFVGMLATYLISWVATVAQYNKFLDVPTVNLGWTMIRDLCNMTFIIALLAIAFSTVLGSEQYSPKMIPKILIVAVLINFSKTIFGFFIDISQIIMLTFVGGFAGGGENNLAKLLGLNTMMNGIKDSASSGGDGDLGLGTLAGLLLALIVSLVAAVTLFFMFITLMYRVMMLWICVIFSPLVILGRAMPFPFFKKMSGEIEKMFIDFLLVGPMLAFFIWLALATAQGSSNGLTSNSSEARDKKIKDDISYQESSNKSGLVSGISSGFLDSNTFQTYFITLAILWGGLAITKKTCGEASGMVGMAINQINKGKSYAMKKGSDELFGNKKEGKIGLFQKGGGLAKGLGIAADKYTGGNISKINNWAKKSLSSSGTGTGAVIGGAIAGPLGVAVGGALGAYFGGKAKQAAKRDSDIENQRFQAHEKGDGGEFLDKDGNKTDTQTEDGWKHDERTGNYTRQNADGSVETYKDKNGKAVSRFGEINVDGKTYRRRNANEDYHAVDNDGNFTVGADGKVDKSTRLNRTKNFGGWGVGDMSDKTAEVHAAWSESNNKTKIMESEAKSKDITERRKNYSGMTDEELKNLLIKSNNEEEKMALGMELAERPGALAKSTDVDYLNKAKDAMKRFKPLAKDFEKKMMEQNPALYCSKKDESGNTTVDAEKLEKYLKGDITKWKALDANFMTPAIYKMMSQKFTPEQFAEVCGSIADTNSEKKAAVKGIDLNALGFEGDDLVLRKAYANTTGNYVNAFKGDKAKLAEYLKSRKNITHLADIDEANFTGNGSEDFLEALSTMDASTMKNVSRNAQISPERKKQIIEAKMKYDPKFIEEAMDDSYLQDYASDFIKQQQNGIQSKGFQGEDLESRKLLFKVTGSIKTSSESSHATATATGLGALSNIKNIEVVLEGFDDVSDFAKIKDIDDADVKSAVQSHFKKHPELLSKIDNIKGRGKAKLKEVLKDVIDEAKQKEEARKQQEKDEARLEKEQRTERMAQATDEAIGKAAKVLGGTLKNINNDNMKGKNKPRP